SVKRELRSPRRERFELLDKLKEQEGAILRAQEQLAGLERLLTNPLAAANATGYFRPRHLLRAGAPQLEDSAHERTTQRPRSASAGSMRSRRSAPASCRRARA